MISGENLFRDDVNKTAFVLKSYQDFLDAKEEFSNMRLIHGAVKVNLLYMEQRVLKDLIKKIQFIFY